MSSIYFTIFIAGNAGVSTKDPQHLRDADGINPTFYPLLAWDIGVVLPYGVLSKDG